MNVRNLLIAFVSLGLGFVLAELKDSPESKVFADGTVQTQIAIDDSKVVAQYANFCRVTNTPEEFIFDYGLNTQPSGMPKQPISLAQRIVMSPYAAKRLLHALQVTVDRHETTFGSLETDVRKRVKPGAKDSSTEQ